MYIKIFLLIATISLCSCVKSDKRKTVYQEQVGDTPFDIKLDNPDFKFCDSTNVYHSRAKITYKKGNKDLEKDIKNNYVYQTSFEDVSGYFFVRLAINCEGKAGRFRVQFVDNEFKESSAPEKLKKQIISILRKLKGWKPVQSKGQLYDGYTFIVVKIANGKIISQ
ncbi:hypothetical protein [Tenacibaculum sp. M341]|uniref:hypothetical protein n=1 Tax=Tenacibaculum sp. M341 TaxID=2530339 RepID=UPI0010445F72|nr:hypothetical protein [Tenacibaculum sp. M341]TCI93182.1 hypothetical protein EYW44_06080 [Tenacibaculum sp. M341]